MVKQCWGIYSMLLTIGGTNKPQTENNTSETKKKKKNDNSMFGVDIWTASTLYHPAFPSHYAKLSATLPLKMT